MNIWQMCSNYLHIHHLQTNMIIIGVAPLDKLNVLTLLATNSTTVFTSWAVTAFVYCQKSDSFVIVEL